MINDATAAYDAGELGEVGALLPALQDTFALINGSYKKMIRYLFDCQNEDPSWCSTRMDMCIIARIRRV